ncbi:hypothetical protein RMCBS344292_06801 [Rhizopus microsporus]|nr:hypothetical protein RMCBS344292_06801 [Rhizopus microsporus]
MEALLNRGVNFTGFDKPEDEIVNNNSTEETISSLSVKTKRSQPENCTRDYNHAVLYSCNALQLDKSQQEQLVKFVDAMNLRPLSMISHDGVEENTLIHENIAAKICANKYDDISLVYDTKKRKLNEDSMLEIIPELPYNKIIFDEDFVELDDDWAKFLNEDWAVKPQMRFACSILLSGMILVKET